MPTAIMISRPKSKPVDALVPPVPGTQSDAKDELLCRLEQEQTIFTEKIEKLERERNDLNAWREGFDLVYDRSPIGYITFDKKGHVHNVNTTALNLLGYQRDQLLHLPLTFLVDPKDIKKLLSHLWHCETHHEIWTTTHLHLRTKARKPITVQLISTPLAVVNNRQMFLTAVVDMTEHAKREHVMEETKDFAEAIVQTVRHPLAVLDSELRIISVNRAFTDFFCRPAQFVRGRVLEVMLNLWWSGNELRNELEKVIVRENPLVDFRVEVSPPDLGKRTLLINARPLPQKANVPLRLLVSLEDVTELEFARKAMSKTNEELEQRVAVRTEALRRSYEQMESFCYSIAHDLRAPLRSMTGFSQLLADEFADQISESGKDYAARIQHSAEHMDHLIRDLLSYGRLNTTPINQASVDLQKVLQEVVAEHDKDIREKHAKVRRKGKLPVVCGHHSVLHTVLANLISNALKFVAADVRPRIEVSAEDRGDWMRIWVADNGIGIAPENNGKIFGVFQRLHGQEVYPGTGIGLAIVAKGVERMGGHVGLESEPGKGSRFWFELPVRGGVKRELPNGSSILIGGNSSAPGKGS